MIECPSDQCMMCTGEACNLCDPGPGQPHCDHDVTDRHRSRDRKRDEDDRARKELEESSGRVGGSMSRMLSDAARETSMLRHHKDPIARGIVEAIISESDAHFAIAATFKRHGTDGMAFRVSSGAGAECPPVDREAYGHIAEATSEGISVFLHKLTGANVMVLDRIDTPLGPDGLPLDRPKVNLDEIDWSKAQAAALRLAGLCQGSAFVVREAWPSQLRLVAEEIRNITRALRLK